MDLSKIKQDLAPKRQSKPKKPGMKQIFYIEKQPVTTKNKKPKKDSK